MEHIGRRRFLVVAGAGAAASFAARLRGSSRPRRIGFLSGLPAGHERARWTEATLKAALGGFGYALGRDLVVDWRWGDGDVARLDALARELVGLGVELIVAFSNAETAAAMRATRTVPIVMIYGIAPVEMGVVASLARPGGNVTGTAWVSPETIAKTLQIAKEANPSAVRMASLAHPTSRLASLTEASDRAAVSLGLKLDRVDVGVPDDVPTALERIAAGKPDILYVVVNPTVEARIRDIGQFARDHKLVSLGTSPAYVLDGGGLLSYSPLPKSVVEGTAAYVHRILRGERPAEMPIELPRRFVLLVHAGTARAMGFTVPASLLLRADRVIE